MARVPDGVTVVFDEAYHEFLDDPPDTLRYVREGRNAIVLRTFSKIQGLASLRIGYGMAPAEMIDILQKTRQPFNVNGIAQAGALAGLADAEHQARTKAVTDEGRALFQKAFAEMGLEFVPSYANFVLVHVGDGRRVFEELLKQGIIVRAMDSYKLPAWVRVSVGTPEENRPVPGRLGEVLAPAARPRPDTAPPPARHIHVWPHPHPAMPRPRKTPPPPADRRCGGRRIRPAGGTGALRHARHPAGAGLRRSDPAGRADLRHADGAHQPGGPAPALVQIHVGVDLARDAAPGARFAPTRSGRTICSSCPTPRWTSGSRSARWCGARRTCGSTRACRCGRPTATRWGRFACSTTGRAGSTPGSATACARSPGR